MAGLGLGSAGVGAIQGLNDVIRRRLEEQAIEEQIARSQAVTAQGSRALDLQGLAQGNLANFRDRSLDQGERGLDLQGRNIQNQFTLGSERNRLTGTDISNRFNLGQGNLAARLNEERGRGGRAAATNALTSRGLNIEEQRLPSQIDLNTAQADLSRARIDGLSAPQPTGPAANPGAFFNAPPLANAPETTNNLIFPDTVLTPATSSFDLATRVEGNDPGARALLFQRMNEIMTVFNVSDAEAMNIALGRNPQVTYESLFPEKFQ